MSSDHRIGLKPTLVQRLRQQLQTDLKQCTRSRDFQRGLQLHSRAAASGLSSDTHVVTGLIQMYFKFGKMQEAQKVFDTLLHPDVVSWTALILGYVENGQSQIALNMFERLLEAEREPFLLDSRIYVAGLSACASLYKTSERSKWLKKGRSIHLLAETTSCLDVYVESSLIDFYSRCGSMTDARRIFDTMRHRNVVSWTVIIQGYVENGEFELALNLFEKMDSPPDPRTFVVAITACGALGAQQRPSSSSDRREWLEKGRLVHSRALTNNCCNVYVQSALVDMYGKCGSISEARKVFNSIPKPNVVSWTSLIQGYVENGESLLALETFTLMQGVCSPNDRTFIAALSACAALASEARAAGRSAESWLCEGRAVHSWAVGTRNLTPFVENALVNMYSECGRMPEARSVFESMKTLDVVSWNSLLHGYVNNLDNQVVLELVPLMDVSGVGMNSRTFVAVIMACEGLMAVEVGRVYVDEMVNRGLDKEVVVANSLVNFYGKTGCVEAAKTVFDSIEYKTIVSWTSLMCVYGLQGDSGRVLQLFERMKEQGVQPDEITLLSALSACGHAGLTTRGRELFDAMLPEYGIRPNVKHYACMIDLLSRANKMEEAMSLVRSMPFAPDVVSWTGILSACSKWRNVEIGELAFESVLSLDRQCSLAYILMANLYRSVGMRDECAKVLDSRRWMEESPTTTTTTTTWTDEAGKVHKFTHSNSKFQIQMFPA